MASLDVPWARRTPCAQGGPLKPPSQLLSRVCRWLPHTLEAEAQSSGAPGAPQFISASCPSGLTLSTGATFRRSRRGAPCTTHCLCSATGLWPEQVTPCTGLSRGHCPAKASQAGAHVLPPPVTPDLPVPWPFSSRFLQLFLQILQPTHWSSELVSPCSGSAVCRAVCLPRVSCLLSGSQRCLHVPAVPAVPTVPATSQQRVVVWGHSEWADASVNIKEVTSVEQLMSQDAPPRVF